MQKKVTIMNKKKYVQVAFKGKKFEIRNNSIRIAKQKNQKIAIIRVKPPAQPVVVIKSKRNGERKYKYYKNRK